MKYFITYGDDKYINSKNRIPLEAKNMNITKLSNNLHVINLNDISNIIYDTIKLIENAQEIYLINSIYSTFIYHMSNRYNNIEHKKIYLHNT
jgi:hypothetical protein